MLGPTDNFVLKIPKEVHKVGAVAGHPNQQVTVFVRVILGGFQSRGVYDIKLKFGLWGFTLLRSPFSRLASGS